MIIIKYLWFKDILNYSWVSRRQQYVLYLDTHTSSEQVCHHWPLPSFWFAISKSNLFSFSDQRWLHKQLIFLDCCLQWISQKKKLTLKSSFLLIKNFLHLISYTLSSKIKGDFSIFAIRSQFILQTHSCNALRISYRRKTSKGLSLVLEPVW